jgi:response regulator NasT
MSRGYKIAVADDEPVMREYFQKVLPEMGHQVVAVAGTGKELVEQCARARPDLVIADIRMPDMDGLEAVEQINKTRPVPTVLVTGHDDPTYVNRAQAGPAMAYLVKPITQADLGPAVAMAVTRFEQMQGLRKEATDLRQSLEDRKLIERAKGIVMRRLHLDEPEAYRRLQRMAADNNRKLTDVANEVLNAEQVFQPLEDGGREYRGAREHHGR